MSTQSWSSRIRHDSDATYQEWRDELITKLGLLVTAGVLAADETNITPAAGARPGTNSEGGYAVYHLADSLHATAPIYLRFGLGTGGIASGPRIQVTTGTSTNGSGVLGGTALSSAINIHNAGASQTSDVARQSYMCCVAGFFGLSWKVAAGNTEGGFFICRTCDSDGTPNAVGALANWSGTTATGIGTRQAFRYETPADAYGTTISPTSGALGLAPQAPLSTAVGADIQVFLGWTIAPRATPLFGVCGVYGSELAPAGTFEATLVGNTPRTYLTLSNVYGPFGPVAVTSQGGLNTAMLWE